MKKTTKVALRYGAITTIFIGSLFFINNRDPKIPVRNMQNDRNIESIVRQEEEEKQNTKKETNNSEEIEYVPKEIKYVEMGEPLILKKRGVFDSVATMEARFYFSDEVNNISEGLNKDEYYRELIKFPQKIRLESIFDLNKLNL